MKWLTVLSFTLLLVAGISAQETEKVPLNFSSYGIKLCVTKDEGLILTTRSGEVGIAPSMTDNWLRFDPVQKNNGMGPLLEQANFFNKDTGFVSGFIQGSDGKYSIIYHTVDGGKNWKVINFGQDSWVDDAVHLDNGEAWLTVAGSGFAYTNDYGFSWKKLKNPEITQRFDKIFFNSQRQGIIGSLWNMIAFTDNNCRSWKLLPTPLDQKKYTKTNAAGRPEINRVAIFKDYYLVAQEDMVFYSKRDTINWTWMANYDDFYTDAENSALFFKTTRGAYVRADENLQPLFTSEKIAQPFDAKCKNGSLFVVVGERVIRFKPDNTVSTAFINRNASKGFYPRSIGYTTLDRYVVYANKLYSQSIFDSDLKYKSTLPFIPDSGELSIVGNNQLLYERNDDSLFYYTLSGEEIRKQSKPKMIESFCAAGIKSITFARGSSGCFHFYEDRLTFTNRNGTFVAGMDVSSGSTHNKQLPDHHPEIPEEQVKGFLRSIPLLFDTAHSASINDLGFTEEEYQQCKKDIISFQKAIAEKKDIRTSSFGLYKNNIDFTRLLSLVDSVKYVSTSTLKSALYDLGRNNTNISNFTTIELLNNEGEKLSITSSYFNPNAFYFPWTVSLNGYSKTTTSIEVYRFLRAVYPALLHKQSKVPVLHAIVKGLY